MTPTELSELHKNLTPLEVPAGKDNFVPFQEGTRDYVAVYGAFLVDLIFRANGLGGEGQKIRKLSWDDGKIVFHVHAVPDETKAVLKREIKRLKSIPPGAAVSESVRERMRVAIKNLERLLA